MQLRALGVSSVLTLTALEGSLHAEPSSVRWQSTGELSVYHDSDAITAVTPSVRAEVRDPLVGWSASGSYLVDVISAASVDIVSSASPHWQEVRHAGALGANYEHGEFALGANGSASYEPDYLSLVGGLVGSLELARKNAKLEMGLSYGHDTAGRTGTPFSVYSLGLDRYTLGAGLELVLDRATTFSPAFDAIFESGRQEKPYRYLPLFDAAVAPNVAAGASGEEVNALRLPGRVAEHTPDSRFRWVLAGRLAHRFQRSTLVLDDRLYRDSWGLTASTSNLRWVLELGNRFSIWPHARFHVQSGVSFWRHAYVGEITSGATDVPVNRTGDREQSPLWTATLGPGLRWDFGDADPRDYSLVLEGDAAYTRYRDALYIDHRWSWLAVIQLARRFQ